MYKYEMHLHSCACSACGVSSAKEMVSAAKEKGYSGVVFTNHFYHGNTAVDRKLPYKEFVEAYKRDYLEAKKFGKSIGVDVFFGIEEVYCAGKEVLIYGISPKTLAECDNFLNMKIDGISKFVRDNGGFCVAAHPFRHRFYIPDPDTEPDMRYFDAIEVYNWCNTEEDNKKAEDFARANKISVIAGSDLHVADKFGGSGIAFYKKPRSGKDFIRKLKNGEYELIEDGKTVKFEYL